MFTFKWCNASKILADAIPRTVSICGAKFLLAANFFIIWIAEKSVRADAVGRVAVGLADGVATADDRAITDVLAFTLTQGRVL